jgi:hypothetical protein
VQDDIVLAEKIFGKDIVILKGKTTRKRPILVVHDTMAVPKALKETQKDVTICIDTFFVNKMSFTPFWRESTTDRRSGSQTAKQAHTKSISRWFSSYISRLDSISNMSAQIKSLTGCSVR